MSRQVRCSSQLLARRRNKRTLACHVKSWRVVAAYELRRSSSKPPSILAWKIDDGYWHMAGLPMCSKLSTYVHTESPLGLEDWRWLLTHGWLANVFKPLNLRSYRVPWPGRLAMVIAVRGITCSIPNLHSNNRHLLTYQIGSKCDKQSYWFAYKTYELLQHQKRFTLAAQYSHKYYRSDPRQSLKVFVQRASATRSSLSDNYYRRFRPIKFELVTSGHAEILKTSLNHKADDTCSAWSCELNDCRRHWSELASKWTLQRVRSD